MTLFEHILIEGRVDDFNKLLARKFNSDYRQKIINRDTSKNHKNLLWIGKMLMTEPDLNDEDLFKNLEIFNKVGRTTDLYSFRDYSSFLKFLQQRSKEVQMGKMALIKAGSHTIKDDKRWLVVVPMTHDASKYFGGGTSWCISTSNDTYWDDYYHENTIIMIKDRTKKPDDPLFKVAIVGNAHDELWSVQNDDKESKIRELARHTRLWDTNDRQLSQSTEDNYLANLPEDLIDDIINYMNDDDIYERQHERYYNLAYERFQDDGRDLLLKELFDATVDYLNVDTDIYGDEFDEMMTKQFADEVQDGDWNQFLSQLWSACISHQGVDDDSFYPSISKREIKNLISDTEYSYETYFDLAKEVLKDDDISNMDDIIKASLKRSEDERYDPYLVLKRQSNQLEGTNYTDILYNSVKIYNARNNPGVFQGQQALKLGNEFGGIVNKFVPRNIDDVIKVLSVNPRAIDMVNWIQKYRKDLREAKKFKLKYKSFFN
jgi:hypothetical protein